MIDVSAQGGCIITPINPTTLTAAGGVLANGTVNVTIRCNNCTDDDGTLDRVWWYDPDGKRLVDATTNQYDYVPGTPHFIRVDDANNDVLLVIPTFNDPYDGTYTCGGKNSTATVVLTIGGKYWKVNIV